MTYWPQQREYRPESHYGRVVPCLGDRPSSLPDMLMRAAAQNPHGEALVCEDFRCSWAELRDLVEAMAAGLRGSGIAPGERVVLFLGNRAEFVIALYAITRIGAVAVPVGVREQAPGLAYIVEQSGARLILHESDLSDRLPEGVEAVPVVGNDPASFVARFSGARGALIEVEPGEDDLALIMYTSGTTGRPKGAMVTHLALVHAGAGYQQSMVLAAEDRSACAVPLSHITGITATLCTMAFTGGCSIIVPEFKADQFVHLAERERITHTLMVPAMYNLILARVDLSRHNLGRWRIGGFGGAPMPVPTIQALHQELPALQLMNCYGATETCGGICVVPAAEAERKAETVGLPLPGTTIRIVNDAGQDLTAGEVGEIWIAGPNVTPGYWQNPEATAANLVDGFWRSGDLGRIDEDGFLHVLDRLKDMINRGGYKIFSAEVEGTLMAHPAVLEAAVIAKPCPVLGERVHAVITLRDGAEPVSQEDLKAYCATRMTDYKQPESFTIGKEPLPRNLNGKVVKTALRERIG